MVTSSVTYLENACRWFYFKYFLDDSLGILCNTLVPYSAGSAIWCAALSSRWSRAAPGWSCLRKQTIWAMQGLSRLNKGYKLGHVGLEEKNMGLKLKMRTLCGVWKQRGVFRERQGDIQDGTVCRWRDGEMKRWWRPARGWPILVEAHLTSNTRSASINGPWTAVVFAMVTAGKHRLLFQEPEPLHKSSMSPLFLLVFPKSGSWDCHNIFSFGVFLLTFQRTRGFYYRDKFSN